MKKTFFNLIVCSLFIAFTSIAFALSPQEMARGALSNLNSTNSSVVQDTLGVSGGSKGNAGKGSGGLDITRTSTGDIPCPTSDTEKGNGNVGGVSFKCQQNSGGRQLSYCLNQINGSICQDNDYKVLSGSSKKDGETSIDVISCDDKSCNVKVSTRRNKVYSGDNLENQGQSALNNQYGNNNSITSMTLGAGVYDQNGNPIVAGKNPNMGKYQETLQNKQSILDCSSRQFSETESKGKTSLCSDPNQVVNIFDKDNSGCKTIETCINSIDITKTHETSCVMAVNTDKITQHDTIPHHTCTKRKDYKKQCKTVTEIKVIEVPTDKWRCAPSDAGKRSPIRRFFPFSINITCQPDGRIYYNQIFYADGTPYWVNFNQYLVFDKNSNGSIKQSHGRLLLKPTKVDHTSHCWYGCPNRLMAPQSAASSSSFTLIFYNYTFGNYYRSTGIKMIRMKKEKIIQTTSTTCSNE